MKNGGPWTQWFWAQLMGDTLTLEECLERLRLELLYRRTGTY
jgi:hypothetical protein